MHSPTPMDVEIQIKRPRSTGSTTSLQALPEGCIANILSLTTPIDACRLSLVSKTFYFAAQSDAVWDRFFPSDLESIISDEYPSLIATFPSKKGLYLALSDYPVIIDHGKKSFQLDKRTGKKRYMKAARDLVICWGDNPQYWDWTIMLECRMIDAQGFHYLPMELSLGIVGGQAHTKQACLDPNLEERDLEYRIFPELERPNVRSDGWLEIEIGEFFNSGLGDEQVEMSVRETKSNQWKQGFFLQGIEVRPKLL